MTYKSENKLYSCLNSLPKSAKIIVVENSNDVKFKQKLNIKYPYIECILTGENLPFTFLKVFGGVFITSLFFYGWIQHFKTDVQIIFKWYCYSCWVLVIIGIIQTFSFLVGFKYGYDFSWFLNKWGFVEGGVIGLRVNAILSEPTYLATALAPVIYVSIHNIFSKSTYLFNKFQSMLILIIAILKKFLD